MRLWLTQGKSLSLILVALMLWHFEGIWLYAQTRAIQKRQEATAGRTASLSKALNGNRFDALLSDLKDTVKRGAAKTKATPEKGFAEIGKLTELKEKLIKENEKNQEYFSQLEELIKQKGLPDEILNRHLQFVHDYHARYEALMNSVEGIESAHKDATGFWGTLTGKNKMIDWDGAIGRTLNFLEENSPRPPKRQFDPHNLPHRSLKADKAIPPKLTREEWLKAFPQESPEAGPKFAHVAKVKNPFAVLQTGPPTDADLAETVEVKFTPEIRQLAESLGKNPVKIFNWVRNNIEFVPTWGSIQGAQLCMQSKSCNAFDTASLLIALLRVSGIPARYQMGTIEIPIEKFKNWAGGFTDADAAASLLASGGVPSVVRELDRSGKSSGVELEHVWVKAFVDYAPSGGSVNIRGNTWLDMDAAFKQYTTSNPPQNLTSAVPFDRDAYLASSTTDSPVGYYRQALTGYIQQNYPGKTLDDFLIKQAVKSYEPAIVGGTLPYHPSIRGIDFTSIPDDLRQLVTFEVAKTGDSNAGLSYTAFLPQLLDKRISLSFMPATAADSQTASSFQGLYFTPPYLVSVKPVLRVDGTNVASGSSIGMGQNLNLALTLKLADGSRRFIKHDITAGDYGAVILAPFILSDTVSDSIARVFRKADERFGTLNIDNSDRDPWVGGGLREFGALYFNQLGNATATLKQLFPVAQFKTAAEALVSSDVEVSSLFGAPRGLALSGITIDARLLEDIVTAKNGQPGTVPAYEKLRGLESSYWEHAIFEAGGVDKDHPGISTVRILQRAKAQGIQISRVSASNLSAIEPQLQVSNEVKQAVEDGVNAGLEVTIPATNVRLGGWNGVGYIVEDPRTGAGAYEISGGFSGGTIKLEYPGLGGGTLPPNRTGRPSAVVAVGGAINYSLESIVTQIFTNKWSVYDSVGVDFFSAGYNVYIAEPYADEFVSFVNGSGAQTNNDIFYYIGHGGDGDLALPNRDDGYEFITPQQLGGRQFKIALLTACATGGECPDGFLSGRIFPCQEVPGLEQAWEAALLGLVVGQRKGKALVGSYSTVRVVDSGFESKLFWSGVLSGFSVGSLTIFIQYSYLRGDPNTTRF